MIRWNRMPLRLNSISLILFIFYKLNTDWYRLHQTDPVLSIRQKRHVEINCLCVHYYSVQHSGEASHCKKSKITVLYCFVRYLQWRRMVILSLLIRLLTTFSKYEMTIKLLEIYALFLSFFLSFKAKMEASSRSCQSCQSFVRKCVLNNRVI